MEDSTIIFIKGRVLGVPVRSGDAGFLDSIVDGVFGEIFNLLHSGVGAGIIGPGARVDEGRGGQEGHV